MSCLLELHKSQHPESCHSLFRLIETSSPQSLNDQDDLGESPFTLSFTKKKSLFASFLSDFLFAQTHVKLTYTIYSVVNIATSYAKCYNGPIFIKADTKFQLPFLHLYQTVSEPPTLLSNIQRN